MAKSPAFKIRYDRRVDSEFLALFQDGGPLDKLRVIARDAALPLDLQFRKNPKTNAQHASLYVGLTAVLNVIRTKDGVRFTAHPTWAATAYGFHTAVWPKGVASADLAAVWPSVELYLERVIPAAVKSHATTEGLVQTVASKGNDADWTILDREVTPSFVDSRYKAEVLGACMAPLINPPWSVPLGVGNAPTKFGAECDLLAVADDGRLLAIEVKPLGAGSITWVPAQAAMYARVLQRWVDVDSATAGDGVAPNQVITGMLHQRRAMGAAPASLPVVPDRLVVSPVVVLQRGAAPTKIRQMLKVRDALMTLDDIPEIEVYEVSILGKFERIA